MRVSTLKLSAAALLAATTLLAAPAAMAVDLDVALLAGKGVGGKPPKDQTPPEEPTYAYYSWMASDVDDMWAFGFTGAGSTITVVDDFSSGDIFEGRLNLTDVTIKHHGDYTSEIAGLIAPGATVVQRDWSGGGPVRFDSSVFNVVNASYSLEASAGYDVANLLFSKRDQSLIDAAWNGTAVLAKAAGNEGPDIVMGEDYISRITGKPVDDYLSLALVGAPGVIFVGALQTNGSPDSQALMATYSTRAGAMEYNGHFFRDQYLVVGVDAGMEYVNYGSGCGKPDQPGHCLYGTSFAAPVVAGYAAIIGSKFANEDAAWVASKLLSTTRRDTLKNIGATGWDATDSAYYGQGEACLSCALAPLPASQK